MHKTRRKTVQSMTGPFIARERMLQCSPCSRVFGSNALLHLVPRGCNVAYDVMVFVGQALFRRHRSTEEVRTELLSRNVHLSASEVGYLGRKFISYLALAHRQATPRIRQAMGLVGGYVLHLDATHEGDAPAWMTGLDSLSKIVLANVKVPSEHAEHIAPFLREIQCTYGNPKACVHDMGTGISKAVTEVFPDILDFICHFHFLRDIGRDFLEPAYGQLRNRLRKYSISSRLSALVRETHQRLGSEKCTDFYLLAKAIKTAQVPHSTPLLPLASVYSLTLWALRAKHTGDGYGFPFDRPLFEFAQRLLELAHRLPHLLLLLPNHDHGHNHPLFKLARKVCQLAKDPMLHQAVEELRWRSHLFDTLRNTMRIAPPGGTQGLNDEGTPTAMPTIRHGVTQFRRHLAQDPILALDPLCRKMGEQIDKYEEKLFADPIEVHTPTGTAIIYPQRTNNILEQFFRELRRGYRRKTGNNSMRRFLQSMLADTPLVKNLDNPDYRKILLDGKANLEELFADLDKNTSTRTAASQSEADRILPGFRPIINLPNLPEQVVRLFIAYAQTAKSN